ncbi:alanine-phosphoribitol ligase [Mesorhizobium sp. M7A.F.Ca.US.011.01.1.1]|uniref:GMC family oxidoreductase n=1 Tax=Mesorhizobium sp. M7A.F.Ca.US.011.01.1.1 TaxID=2496741 RepID=UPI000FC9A4B7|nr:GMC family oxidoreductase N-terminal domain-containing protein [Mesorhizobium sp. M7A.F.Ca.US.011.01.1.1]RUX21455.1 alanine-phosphoribitol ligase [Mesorhizobium sp. M7A.F.Ca.US.011.01.1.1]
MYDYIVVGGGSAGCTISSRLSEDSDSKVLLLEQGDSDWNPYIHMPVTYYKTSKGNMLTRYKLDPQVHQGGLEPEFVQGRVLGGGSSVNAMVYMRGCPQDYENWVQDGAEGWGYKDVLPYFKKAEDNERFSGDVHGVGGPLGVSDQRHTHYLTKAWARAAQEMGINFNPDFNSGSQAGVGFYQVTMRNGLRCSAATAYLKPARNRKNLTIHTRSKTLKIIVENGRAVGVQYLRKGQIITARAEREVVVCSGAIGSPHLLMVSGIGPANHLKQAGVQVVHDLPGVGQNLQDHFDMFLIYELSGAHSYDKYKKLRWQALAGLQYALFRNGPVTSNICEGGLLWYGDDKDPLPSLQYHFLPGAGVEEGSESVPSGNGCTTNVYQSRPRSRGWVTLKSSDPMVFPSVNPNYLAEEYDVECLAEGVRIGQEILRQRSMEKYVSRPYRPGEVLKTKAERMQFVRETGQGALHPSGACRMGNDDMAVVDTQLRVRGIDGLRVADSSIMPRVVSGNLNAPTIMIGERTADIMRGNRRSAVQ